MKLFHQSDLQMPYCFQCMGVLTGGETVCPHCGKKPYDAEANERALPPGTVLKNAYLLGRVIGEGGMALTYIGMDLNFHGKVAVKEYFPAALAKRDVNAGTGFGIYVTEERAEFFYREGLKEYGKEPGRLSKFASLPGIVSVRDFFYENNTAYMVMDFVDGITLEEYAARNGGKLPWDETLHLLHPILLLLREVHRAGIIHGDISADNIMVSESGEVVLIDFGAARKMGDNQRKTAILKRGYAPLEQYREDGNQGTWSDIYSFCATIYRVVGGRYVPDAQAVAEGKEQIIPLRTLAADIPDFLEQVLQKGMESEISARIQSTEELEGYLYKGKRVKGKAKVASLWRKVFPSQ